MSSYDRNIERLKANQSAVSAQEQKHILQAGNASANRRISDAQSVIRGLEKLSPTLQNMHEKRLARLEEEGREAARQARESKLEDMSENAKKLQEIELAKSTGELAFEFETAEQQELMYQQLKQQVLQAGGPDSYYDAERLAQLSPHQQTGYAKEKLRMFAEAYPGMLQNELMNSTEVINLNGIKFTAAELRDNNLALPMKEAAINVMQRRILERTGIHQYSDEMLRLTKTNEVIAKAKESLMATHKARYNVQSSQNIRNKANIQWEVAGRDPGGVTGDDLHLFLITSGNTLDNKNQILGNAGGWNHVMSKLTSQGIEKDDPALADRIGSLVIPDALAIQVGAKKGTTYAQHWPGRFSKLKQDIKKGYSDKVKAELTYQKGAGVDLQGKFIEAAKEAGGNGTTLSTAEVNDWKRQFGDLGLPVPESVTKYETASMRDEREDKQQIEALMASQKGYISDEQLDSFHPIAALEYREKASRLQKAALQEFGSQDKIKAALNTAFTNMGIKGNEKSLAWVEAYENAKADYAIKYNQYVAMGYPPSEASHHALYSPQVINPETKQPIPDSMGVLAEIKTNGEGSKYVMTGQAIEKKVKAGSIRVGQIKLAKDEILNDPTVVTSTIIGGDYGHRQITSIKNNLEKHGPRGLYMDEGALAYYEGLARGRNAREGGWWGIVDAQLKAAGHEGLNGGKKPVSVQFAAGTDEDGNDLPDPTGMKIPTKRMAAAMNYPNRYNNQYLQNCIIDCHRNDGISIFDSPDWLAPWITITDTRMPEPRMPDPNDPWYPLPPRRPVPTGEQKDPNDPLTWPVKYVHDRRVN
jgi:hypothetical protein